MGINSPLPASLKSECKKCGKILTSFVNPRQAFGPDKVIPPSILSNAKGFAIITILKAGCLGSGRVGSGLVVARLPDGSWSAPSAIAAAGGGFGGQIGFELTDFVFVLNDASAVKTFAQMGSITLGGNASLAAGPVGRNAEAAGAASLKSVSGIFSYSKTKGLFAGVSLEGMAIIERRDANEKLYGTRFTAMQLLTGSIRPPPAADSLMTVLNSRVFSGMRVGTTTDESMYNDMPTYDERQDGTQQHGVGNGGVGANEFGRPSRSSTWRDDMHGQRDSTAPARANTVSGRQGVHNTNNRTDTFGSSEKRIGPGRPTAPKPNFGDKGVKKTEAVALFNFDADQPGDLGFKKGEVITILKRTDSDNDWWTGMIGTRHGIFPSNYVKLQ
ncbi:hypothetical protein E4U31_007653 [Claviceps sp. LM219 group G6]|nr:hypothetical protein E4U15_004344 [Claviceps sp. LM218 group G6]KAG6107176.1 hypothetical protein E4U14_004299 [Claviceps sp. LM454 group G7]KAG6113883.1 hypothetical protein E4U31_007653 [Claviceps sp. LM219 group G6]